jgi:hypothetical protein
MMTSYTAFARFYDAVRGERAEHAAYRRELIDGTTRRRGLSSSSPRRHAASVSASMPRTHETFRRKRDAASPILAPGMN